MLCLQFQVSIAEVEMKELRFVTDHVGVSECRRYSHSGTNEVESNDEDLKLGYRVLTLSPNHMHTFGLSSTVDIDGVLTPGHDVDAVA